MMGCKKRDHDWTEVTEIFKMSIHETTERFRLVHANRKELRTLTKIRKNCVSKHIFVNKCDSRKFKKYEKIKLAH